VFETLVSHALLVILIPPAKVWLLERGVALFGSPSTCLLAEESPFSFGSPCEVA
jgi:hypothetical protein